MLTVLALLAPQAQASAYYFSDIGIRGFSRAGAFVAGVDDARAMPRIATMARARARRRRQKPLVDPVEVVVVVVVGDNDDDARAMTRTNALKVLGVVMLEVVVVVAEAARSRPRSMSGMATRFHQEGLPPPR